MGVLPDLALQQIVQEISQLGRPHIGNLRLSSKQWKSVYDAEVTKVRCYTEQLAAAMPCISHLPKLDCLKILGSQVQSCTLQGHLLSGLQATLTSMTVAGGHLRVAYEDVKMDVDGLCPILSNWNSSLTHLHLDDCNFHGRDGGVLHSPGFFAQFPMLRSLILTRICTTPIMVVLELGDCPNLRVLNCSVGKLLAVDVTGCSQLETLDCTQNSISHLGFSASCKLTTLECELNNLSILDVSACTNLQQLSCHDNRMHHLDLSSCKLLNNVWCHHNELASLNLSACASLRRLYCNHNKLETIFISDSAKLDKLRCYVNRSDLILLECTSAADFACYASRFVSIAPTMPESVQKLHLVGFITWPLELGAFSNLKELQCSFGPAASCNLTGCTAVELDMDSHTSSLQLLNRNAVAKLTIREKMCFADMVGFTTLQELFLCVDFGDMSYLDLSLCGRLSKIKVQSCGECYIEFINLDDCVMLTDLHLVQLPDLSELNVSNNKVLESLTCADSSIVSLDVSCCPLLQTLDIRHSLMLSSLTTGSLQPIKSCITMGCPLLPRL